MFDKYYLYITLGLFYILLKVANEEVTQES